VTFAVVVTKELLVQYALVPPRLRPHELLVQLDVCGADPERTVYGDANYLASTSKQICSLNCVSFFFLLQWTLLWCIDLYCEPNEQMFIVHVTEALRFGQSTQALSVGNLTLALSLCPVSKASWRMIGLFDNKV
jgi:hypothetical protein